MLINNVDVGYLPPHKEKWTKPLETDETYSIASKEWVAPQACQPFVTDV